jgi:hypothetical protein
MHTVKFTPLTAVVAYKRNALRSRGTAPHLGTSTEAADPAAAAAAAAARVGRPARWQPAAERDTHETFTALAHRDTAAPVSWIPADDAHQGRLPAKTKPSPHGSASRLYSITGQQSGASACRSDQQQALSAGQTSSAPLCPCATRSAANGTPVVVATATFHKQHEPSWSRRLGDRSCCTSPRAPCSKRWAPGCEAWPAGWQQLPQQQRHTLEDQEQQRLLLVLLPVPGQRPQGLPGLQ